MLLRVILNDGAPYPEKELKVPGIARTAEEGDQLIAYNGSGDKKAQFNRADVRNYHLEED